jgi:hypothetical protein
LVQINLVALVVQIVETTFGSNLDFFAQFGIFGDNGLRFLELLLSVGKYNETLFDIVHACGG